MKPEEIAATLHPLEVRFLSAFAAREAFSDRDAPPEGVTEAQLRTVIEWQLTKGCVEVVEVAEERFVELTELGQSQVAGTPELAVAQRLAELGPVPVSRLVQEFAGRFESSQIGMAVGALKEAGAVRAGEGGTLELVPQASLAPFQAAARLLQRLHQAGRVPLAALSAEDAERVEGGSRKRGKSRGLYRVTSETTRRLRLTPLGREAWAQAQRLGRSGEEINLLTPKMLADGSWRGKTFRPFNLKLRPPRRVAGRAHPYRAFLDLVRRKLLALGFEEMRGELVETEFWNMDALFMPQFHSARDIHDVYFVKNPTHAATIEEPFASRVAEVHSQGGPTGSRGWGYTFDHQRSRRLVLRSQGTVLSARWLHQARCPGKYFGIARCFRYDQVDATHAPDFFQCEGIVLGRDIDFVTLLGLLKLFALEVARAPEMRFAPAYFPFTEPSVEIHIRHPQVGWMELGGAGIFRPEVTDPQGVHVPVIAWGLGLDRMAMMALGLDDIRDLFAADLNTLRRGRLPLSE
ncbi:MAG: phenylalanine--tRNA ligase subunit alpha [Myxococcales bacterium]|nr:phenylalanine--tRNA ligase subunit alpha [Myxococcales bacterium]